VDKKEFKDKIILLTYGIILFVLLMNYNWIGNFFGYVGKVLSPFIIGFIMAFMLNVLVKMLEKGPLNKLKKGKRVLSIIISLVLVFGFVIILLFILIPQLKNAGMIFVENIPKYQDTIYEIGDKFGLSSDQLKFIDLESGKIEEEITTLIKDNSDNIIDFSMGFANSVISGFTTFFVGLVFSIYILLDKENLKRQFKKLLMKFCPKKVYDKIIDIAVLSNVTFANFLKVQVLEACILGILCFIGMLIFRFPYAATISVLVGFTALIPIFGAFIGCVVGAFLIFMTSPWKALAFVVFFLILQQIEGNFIYPRVVGGKIGLPSIWVLVAVMIGGSVGGVFGMLLGVPCVSILYSLLKVYVNDDKGKKMVKEAVKEGV